MTKEYREKRNARIIGILRANLGADYDKPLPESNRQFEALTTALSKLGADGMAQVWAQALACGGGKPDSIKRVLGEVVGGVETGCGEGVEGGVDSTLGMRCGESVEDGVESGPEIVETVPSKADVPPVVVAIPVESLQPKQLPRRLRLECTKNVLAQLGGVHKVAMGSGDAVLMELYRDVVQSILDMVDDRDELYAAKDAVSRALRGSVDS